MTTHTTMTKMTTLPYSEYSYILESIDTELGYVKHDDVLENIAKMSLPTSIADSVQVMYTDPMDKHELRVIKLKNHDGNIEYHIHNNNMFNARQGDVSRHALADTLNLIHHDAKHESTNGNKIVLQTLPDSDLMPRFKLIAHRLALRSGKRVVDTGMKPFTSNPHVQGPTLTIE